MVPAIGDFLEAVPLRDNVEEDEKALLDADVRRGVRLCVLDNPIGQLHEGDLVHVTELIESNGYAIQQVFCPLGASSSRDGHVEYEAPRIGLEECLVERAGWDERPEDRNNVCTRPGAASGNMSSCKR